MLRLAGERDELRVVDDQIGNPTSADAIAIAIVRIAAAIGAKQGRWGTFHFAGEGDVTWCGFARAIVDGADWLAHKRGSRRSPRRTIRLRRAAGQFAPRLHPTFEPRTVSKRQNGATSFRAC